MPTNDFKALATGAGANVITQAEFDALAATLIANGFTSGVVPSAQFNKILRQTSSVAAAVAQFIADNQAGDVLDDGDTEGFAAKFLAALNGSGTTEAQFDNSTKRATTAFVQRALGNVRGEFALSANTVLTAAHVGGTIIGDSVSAGYTLTLPAANSVPAGARLHFINYNGGVMTIVRAGGDSIAHTAASIATSVALALGDTLTLESDGGTAWFPVDGSAQLPYSSKYAASFNSSGYQKFPSGLILQWVSNFNAQANGADPFITWPIAFPTSALIAVAAPRGPGTGIVGVGDPSATGVTISIRNNTTNGFYVVALGR